MPFLCREERRHKDETETAALGCSFSVIFASLRLRYVHLRAVQYHTFLRADHITHGASTITNKYCVSQRFRPSKIAAFVIPCKASCLLAEELLSADSNGCERVVMSYDTRVLDQLIVSNH